MSSTSVAYPAAPPTDSPSNPTPPQNGIPTLGPPPKYQRLVVTRYATRWPFLIFSVLGFIWAIAMGVDSIRDISRDGETTKEGIFDLILGIMYLVVAVAEAIGIAVSAMQTKKLARVLFMAIPVGVLAAVGASIVAVIAHYVVKSDSINQCINYTTDLVEVDRNGRETPVTESRARTLCNAEWSRDTWKVFAWLVVISLLAVFFSVMALSYYHQLKAPAPVANQNIPLQNYANNPPPPGNYWGAQQDSNNQQPWMVPPYPGPPAGSTPGAYEKGEFQPVAEWANSNPQYSAPPGPPPQQSQGGFGGFGGGRSEDRERAQHAEEEEAWERAQSQGVTAHLTGHAPELRNKDRESGDSSGYVITNQEEDEAWERARREGVTAHLTGQQGTRKEGNAV